MTDEHFKRIEELLVLIARAQKAPVLENELADTKMAQLFKLTGSITANEATNRLKCSKHTVIDAWKRWEQMGLIVKDGKQYRRVI